MIDEDEIYVAAVAVPHAVVAAAADAVVVVDYVIPCSHEVNQSLCLCPHHQDRQCLHQKMSN